MLSVYQTRPMPPLCYPRSTLWCMLLTHTLCVAYAEPSLGVTSQSTARKCAAVSSPPSRAYVLHMCRTWASANVAIVSPACSQWAQRCLYILLCCCSSSICLPYAVTNPTTNNTPVGELIAGEKYVLRTCSAYIRLMHHSSLKLFVLSGAWRDARYLHEPGYVYAHAPRIHP